VTQLVVSREAEAEYAEAAAWYANRSEALRARFIAQVRDTFAKIEASPERFAFVKPDVRMALVAKFPYAIFFRKDAARVVVLCVFHTSRDPSIWQQRI
jgi:plasmid stabilization system protein ParE